MMCEVKDSVFNDCDTVLFFISVLSMLCILKIPNREHSAFTLITDFGPLLLLASLSEISLLAAAVGGGCAVILVLLGIFVAVRFYRKKHMTHDIEMSPREQEWKDPTVW